MNITTDKEAFEYIRQYLLTQNEKSIDEGANCMYRGILQKDLKSLDNLGNSEDQDWWENGGEDAYYEALADLPKDARCAVGAIISDDVYDPEIENSGIQDNPGVLELVQESNPNWKVDYSSKEMLSTLQRIHDRNQPEQWWRLFKELENNFNEKNQWIGEEE